MNEMVVGRVTLIKKSTFRPSLPDDWSPTVTEISKTNFEWNIQFAFLDNPTTSIKSPRFLSEVYCAWTLSLRVTNLSIDILLHLERGAQYSEIAKPIQLSTRIANKKGESLYPSEKLTVFSNDLISSDEDMVYSIDKHDFMKSKFNGIRDNLNIYCTVEISTLKTKLGFYSSKDSSDIRRSQLILTQLEEFLENKTLSDVNLNVGGRVFHGHNIILAARSKVFAAMFNHETAEKLLNNVDIQDVDPDVFQEVLRYVYTGQMSSGTLDKMAVGVLAVADKYFLDQLKAECESHLMKRMSADNCLELLALAAQPHPAMHLKKYAVDYFRRFASLVMATDGWKKAKEEKLIWSCELIEMLFA
ncbi:speckle-type POZ protein B [Daphnia magna]|uniref:speckle-type POZ protein B n=1 Tax=Daphnia magna TaxID=35525 RepID=UPI001E1BBBC9|nr:speckle-type POZ protein B [Daphnia magna]XP_045028770.1 speckle-type POZ protein B [Daphnia magna]